MAQHAFKGLRVHHYPCHGTPILRGAMTPLTGGRLGWTDTLCTGLVLSTWLPVSLRYMVPLAPGMSVP